MSDNPLWKVHCELVAEAIEAEKKRYAAMAEEWGTPTLGQPDGLDYVRCRNLARAIRGDEPEPPADELMTVAKAIKDLELIVHDTHGNWRTLEVVLTALVEAQARRDAELLAGRARLFGHSTQTITSMELQNCYNAILTAAGLA